MVLEELGNLFIKWHNEHPEQAYLHRLYSQVEELFERQQKQIEDLQKRLKYYKSSNCGFRSSSNWRYRVIKGYKHRAQKFAERASTPFEKECWTKVVDWFDSILKKRFLTKQRAVGVPKVEAVFVHRKEVEKAEAKVRELEKKLADLEEAFEACCLAYQMVEEERDKAEERLILKQPDANVKTSGSVSSVEASPKSGRKENSPAPNRCIRCGAEIADGWDLCDMCAWRNYKAREG